MKKGTQVLFVLFLSFFHVSIKGVYDKNLSPYILIITKFLMEAFSKTVPFCKKKRIKLKNSKNQYVNKLNYAP